LLSAPEILRENVLLRLELATLQEQADVASECKRLAKENGRLRGQVADMRLRQLTSKVAHD
jgi:hypothetical protein